MLAFTRNAQLYARTSCDLEPQLTLGCLLGGEQPFFTDGRRETRRERRRRRLCPPAQACGQNRKRSESTLDATTTFSRPELHMCSLRSKVSTRKKKKTEACEPEDGFCSVFSTSRCHCQETLIFLSAALLRRRVQLGLFVVVVVGVVNDERDRLSAGDKTRQADPAGNPRGWNCHRHKSLRLPPQLLFVCVCGGAGGGYVINDNLVFRLFAVQDCSCCHI